MITTEVEALTVEVNGLLEDVGQRLAKLKKGKQTAGTSHITNNINFIYSFIFFYPLIYSLLQRLLPQTSRTSRTACIEWAKCCERYPWTDTERIDQPYHIKRC